MKSLAYGYMRVADELGDEELWQLELGLKKLTEAEGLCLTGICYECQAGYYGRFYQLLERLKQVPVRHVVVPSPNHLSAHPLLREQLLMRLDKAGVRVWVVEP